MQGDGLRLLQALRREHPHTDFVFLSERKALLSKAKTRLAYVGRNRNSIRPSTDKATQATITITTVSESCDLVIGTGLSSMTGSGVT